MSTKYFALLTNIGAAKLANATALGSHLAITQMAVGDGGGSLPTPTPAQTKLVNEKRRAPLNALSVDPQNTNQIIAEQVIPETEGGWWIREIGLYDSDGDLIAVANCADTYKPQLQEGSGRVQTVRMILIVNSADAITLKIDPAVVLATRQYVDDKAIEVKAYADSQLNAHITAANPHPQYAPLNSPALTGVPSAPTADKSTNSTQLATTAFVKNTALLKEQNGADIADKSAFLANLGLSDKFSGRYLQTIKYTSSGQYTPSAGTQKIIVEMVGAGASGASAPTVDANTYTSSGGGGGGGGYLKFLVDLKQTKLKDIAIVIGAGGASTTGTIGNTGGNTLFGNQVTSGGTTGYICYLQQQYYAVNGTSAAAIPGHPGSYNFTQEPGYTLVTAENGNSGGWGYLGPVGQLGGYGGASKLSGNAPMAGTPFAGNSGTAAGPGAGGGGTCCAPGNTVYASAKPSGAGADGIVIIYEYS
ncbi:phage tail protein [Dickeya zeae]|uniref:phage tail protein n=1 Tax=Dickeya zeae TaxID=204042 RepID=UPI002054F87C|nr:phage tail protein [Dickeya zeae]UPT55771.1 phage tail protein [Dickeya zeae]